jgi:hypothetical protein
VVRHVAAALDLEDLDAAAPQGLGVEREARRLGAAAQRDDGGVFAEEQEVGGQRAGETIVGEAALESQGLTVGRGAEVQDGKRQGGQGSGVRGERRRSRSSVIGGGRR